MRVLIIGFGSIGHRHAEILRELGHSVSLQTAQQSDAYPCYDQLAAALTNEQPDYVVVANETGRHLASVQELARLKYSGRLTVEKPLFAMPATLPALPFASMHVAYQLRFHPMMQTLKAALAGRHAISASLYVGQHLADWRPGRDHRSGYSARAGEGGVLRDLSHELDYLLWLFGPWRRVAALGGNFGACEIAAEETASLLIEAARCPVCTVQLSYLDRPPRRQLRINCMDGTIDLDLLSGILSVDGKQETLAADRNGPIRAMHRSILQDAATPACTLAEAQDVMQLIAAAETAMQAQQWVRAS